MNHLLKLIMLTGSAFQLTEQSTNPSLDKKPAINRRLPLDSIKSGFILSKYSDLGDYLRAFQLKAREFFLSSSITSKETEKDNINCFSPDKLSKRVISQSSSVNSTPNESNSANIVSSSNGSLRGIIAEESNGNEKITGNSKYKDAKQVSVIDQASIDKAMETVDSKHVEEDVISDKLNELSSPHEE